jgi:DNA repair exonuclease SbcCD ATPase subunit
MRSIKPDKLEIYRDGSLLPQDAHVKDYQSMFEEDIFGLDLKTFTSLVHSNTNNSSANILSMKKPEKRKLMERMFDLTVFSRMNEICNEKLRKIDSNSREVELKIQSGLEKIAQAKGMVNQFKEEIKSKAVLEKELADLQLEFKELSEDYPSIETEIEDLKQQVQEMDEHHTFMIQTIEKKEVEIQTKLKHVKEEIEEIESFKEVIKENKKLQDKRKKLVKAHGEAVTIKEHISELEEANKSFVAKAKKAQKAWDKIDKEVIELKADLKNCEKMRDQLKTGVCPVCGSDVKDSKAHYGKEIASIKRKITNRDKKKKPLDDEIESIDKDIIANDRDIEDLHKSKDEILELDSKITVVTGRKEEGNLHEEKEKHTANLKMLSEKKGSLKEKHKSERQHFVNKREDLKAEFAKIKRKEKEVEELQTQVRTEQDNIKKFEKMIAEQEQIVQSTLTSLDEFNSGAKKSNTLKDYITNIKILLKDEKIKQHMISKIMPYLNQQANYYLAEVDYSFYINIDRWLDIDIKGPGIANATYGSLSGGEGRGIDIAIQLGFLDIARTQQGIFPDLLTFDELLDSSIDGQGIGEVLKIVRVKQRETDGKFFIISHRSEIDSELIDNRYHVVKENGYSRIEI